MKKNIILVHPMNAPDGKSFTFEHARRMLEREKKRSTGWELKNKDDSKLFEPKKIGNNADRVNSDSGKLIKATKKGDDSKGGESRGEVKAT